MKITKYLLIFLISILLGGCSLLGEVNDSLDYANEAIDYVNTLSTFAEDAPQLIQDAAANAEVKAELENQLTSLLQEIENFNSLDPPAIAEEIHQQIVVKNEMLIEEINQIMDNGQILMDQLENTQILDTINEITTLKNQIEDLGI